MSTNRRSEQSRSLRLFGKKSKTDKKQKNLPEVSFAINITEPITYGTIPLVLCINKKLIIEYGIEFTKSEVRLWDAEADAY